MATLTGNEAFIAGSLLGNYEWPHIPNHVFEHEWHKVQVLLTAEFVPSTQRLLIAQVTGCHQATANVEFLTFPPVLRTI